MSRVLNYPVVLHKDPRSDYGVTVPDLPGCFSAGSTVDEALSMAREAIELHLEGMVADGESIPWPGSIERHRANRDFASGVWAVIPVDRSSLRLRTRRLNITLPERVLDALDRYADERGETRSGLLAEAVTTLIGRRGDRALRRASRGRKRAARRRA